MAKAKNNKLNMLIGTTARTNVQLVGLQITNGNLIALAFSIVQISAGLMIVLFPKAAAYAATLPGQYQTTALVALESGVGLLGVPLAVLVERLTLGGLKRVYAAFKAIGKLKDEHEARLERGEIADDKKADAEKLLKRRASRYGTSRIAGFIAAGAGSLISMALGSLLWDMVFSSAGLHLVGLAQYITYVGPFLVAVIIPFTFADSELSKDMQDDAIKESIHGTTILEEVLQNEGRSMQIDLALESIEGLRNDPAKKEQAITKVQEALVKGLEDAANLVALPAPQTVAALPAPHQTGALDAEYSTYTPATPAHTPIALVGMPKIAPQLRQATNTISLMRFTALPAPAVDDQADDQDDSAPEIELESEFEQNLFSELLQADQADLVEALFQLHNQQAPLSAAISLLRQDYPDYEQNLTRECVDRVWRKIIHEADTEPLTASRPAAQRAPKTAQRRKRPVTGVQGKPRSAMTPAKMRKLEQILSTDPTISDRALGAQLKVSPNTAKRYRSTINLEQA